MSDFEPFPKIARLSREVIITEKLDGTNAQVLIEPATTNIDTPLVRASDGAYYNLYAGSRNRWLKPTKTEDNYGFARWVYDHAEELVELGAGRHFAEWWGGGIQRGYGLPKGEKRFSLFNVGRWVRRDNPDGTTNGLWPNQQYAPACCDVVPVLHRGPFDTSAVSTVMERLATFGSVAAPGFMKPEGIIVFHTANGTLFKKTFEKDEAGKEAA